MFFEWCKFGFGSDHAKVITLQVVVVNVVHTPVVWRLLVASSWIGAVVSSSGGSGRLVGGWCSRCACSAVLRGSLRLQASIDHMEHAGGDGSWKPATGPCWCVLSSWRSAGPRQNPHRALAVSPGRSENSTCNVAIICPGESFSAPSTKPPVVESLRLAGALCR